MQTRTVISYPVDGHEWTYVLDTADAPLPGDLVELGGEQYVVICRTFKFLDDGNREIVCHCWPLPTVAPKQTDLASRLGLHVCGCG